MLTLYFFYNFNVEAPTLHIWYKSITKSTRALFYFSFHICLVSLSNLISSYFVVFHHPSLLFLPFNFPSSPSSDYTPSSRCPQSPLSSHPFYNYSSFFSFSASTDSSSFSSSHRHPVGRGTIYVGNQTAAENITFLKYVQLSMHLWIWVLLSFSINSIPVFHFIFLFSSPSVSLFLSLSLFLSFAIFPSLHICILLSPSLLNIDFNSPHIINHYSLTRNLGITRVVNCTNGVSRIPNFHQGTLQYYTFMVRTLQIRVVI